MEPANAEDADVRYLELENVANFLTVKKVCVAILKSPSVEEKERKLALVSYFYSMHCKCLFETLKSLSVDNKMQSIKL